MTLGTQVDRGDRAIGSAGGRQAVHPLAPFAIPVSPLARLRSRLQPDLLRWKAHHALSHRAPVRIPFWGDVIPGGSLGGERANLRVLILSHDSPICQSQIYPFYFYRRELRRRYGAEIREYDLNSFMREPSNRSHEADIVLLQPWFTLGDDSLLRLLDTVRQRCRPRRVVFLDSYAPTDLRFAKTLAEHVDVYVKKHVLADRSQYGRPTLGDTGLMDYYGRRYGLDFPSVTFEVPPVLLDKLVVGPSFATADYMLRSFAGETLEHRPRDLEIHARMAEDGTDWYKAARAEALSAVQAIRDVKVVAGTGVSRFQFLQELNRSRLCFSPFGYGEVAWRDYEAVMCGSLLLKPDMSHVETNPNIFVAGETYVPLRWDLGDLEEKVRYYLSHEEERRRLAQNAYGVLRDYFREGRFVQQMAPLFQPEKRVGRRGHEFVARSVG